MAQKFVYFTVTLPLRADYPLYPAWYSLYPQSPRLGSTDCSCIRVFHHLALWLIFYNAIPFIIGNPDFPRFNLSLFLFKYSFSKLHFLINNSLGVNQCVACMWNTINIIINNSLDVNQCVACVWNTINIIINNSLDVNQCIACMWNTINIIY